MREENIREIRELVTERTGAEVTVSNVTKNNETELIGMNVREKGKKAGQTIYLDGLLEQIEEGEISITEAVDNIVSVYEKNKDSTFGIGESFTLDKEYILDRVEYKLISKKLNKKTLERVPYKEFLDLAVTYIVIVERTERGTASFQLKNEMIEAYGISFEELDKAAYENTHRAGFKKMCISELMSMMIGRDIGTAGKDEKMYVLSNESGVNGANVMIYNDLFDEIATMYNSDLYVLPSSIHEVIAVPASEDMEVKYLKMMVLEVNDSEVSEDEILSGTVYKYSKKNGKMSIA